MKNFTAILQQGFQPNMLQMAGESSGVFRAVQTGLHVPAEGVQISGCGLTGLFQRLQPLLLIGGRGAVATGGRGEGRQPLCAGDVPLEAVVFQPVQTVTVQAADAPTQPVQHSGIGQAVLQGIETTQRRLQGGLLQQVGFLAEIQGQIVFFKGRGQGRAIAVQVAAHHRHVPAADTGQCPLAQQRRGKLALGGGIRQGVQAQPLPGVPGPGAEVIQLLCQTLQRGRALSGRRRAGGDHAFDAPAPGHAAQPLRGLQRLGIQGLVPAQGQRHGHIPGTGQYLFQKIIFLSGKALEAVHKHMNILEQPALLQPPGSQLHPGGRIKASRFTQGIILSINDADIPHLWRDRLRFQQLLGRNAAGHQFPAHLHQLFHQLRPAGTLVILQRGLDLAQRPVHGEHAAAGIQSLRPAAGLGQHILGQLGEGGDGRIGPAPVAADGEQPPLRLVGAAFRHQQQARAALLGQAPQLFQQAGGFPAAGRSGENGEHNGTAPFIRQGKTGSPVNRILSYFPPDFSPVFTIFSAGNHCETRRNTV